MDRKISNGMTVDGTELAAVQNDALYQWVDCSNGFKKISGATKQVFTATADGQYAVIINSGMCTDTSECVTVSTTGLKQIHVGNDLSIIYPNPNKGIFTIQLGVDARIEIYDALGNLMYRVDAPGGGINIDLTQVGSGLYVVKTVSEKTTSVHHVMVHPTE